MEDLFLPFINKMKETAESALGSKVVRIYKSYAIVITNLQSFLRINAWWLFPRTLTRIRRWQWLKY
jgi:hypothetical protein